MRNQREEKEMSCCKYPIQCVNCNAIHSEKEYGVFTPYGEHLFKCEFCQTMHHCRGMKQFGEDEECRHFNGLYECISDEENNPSES